MLLAIDIGNTDATLGVFEDRELRATWNVASGIYRTTDEYAVLLLNLLHYQGLDKADIKQVAICSVVPPLAATFNELFESYFQVSPLVVGTGTKTGVRIRMDFPSEVGADRIVNAAAAHHLYQGPVIIADFGTATTFDAVSKEGDYLGGAISPGVYTAAESLFAKAAMLPRVELTRPKHAIGTNTVSAMQSGIIFGYVGLIEGIVARFREELGPDTKVVATGGAARLIARETSVIETVNMDLTLIGLRLVYFMNRV